MALEHGILVSEEIFGIMAKRGIYFDPTLAVIHNYDKNRKSYIGIPNYTEEGIEMMPTQALPKALENFF